jgi:uncharacterized protein (DUF433 family)
MTKQSDWSGCPMVESVPGRLSGVPVLTGTRLSADNVADNHRRGMTVAEIADQFEVAEEKVRAVVDYAALHAKNKKQRRRAPHPA